jgi:hypothetical protein
MWRFARTWWSVTALAACDIYLVVRGWWWAALLASAGTLIYLSAVLIVVVQRRFANRTAKLSQ